MPPTSPLERLDARLKLVAALALVALASLTPRDLWPLPIPIPLSCIHLLALAILAAGFAAARLPLLPTARRLAAFALLLIVWCLLIPLSYGLERGSMLAASVIVKGLLSFSAILLLAGTTPTQELLAALARLGMPRLLVATLAAMQRYTSVLAQEASRMGRAREARSFARRRRLSVSSMRAAATLVGMSMVRSAERAQRVHAAMLARGYDGRPRHLDP